MERITGKIPCASMSSEAPFANPQDEVNYDRIKSDVTEYCKQEIARQDVFRPYSVGVFPGNFPKDSVTCSPETINRLWRNLSAGFDTNRNSGNRPESPVTMRANLRSDDNRSRSRGASPGWPDAREIKAALPTAEVLREKDLKIVEKIPLPEFDGRYFSGEVVVREGTTREQNRRIAEILEGVYQEKFYKTALRSDPDGSVTLTIDARGGMDRKKIADQPYDSSTEYY